MGETPGRQTEPKTLMHEGGQNRAAVNH